METPRFSRNRRPLRLTTSLRRGVAAVAACFMVGQPFANPVNPTVVSGTASFSQTGNTLTVTNSNGAIINWDKFSIKAGETTHFAQPSVSSAVLNRVLNDPSAIYGTLSSNGRVWLINPAGIMVGAGGRIDTAGFVASTLNIRNEDFLAGRKLFENTPGAANVINQGEIRTPTGGSVYLVGSNVSNDGIIHTPAGETILAAGNTVSLIDSATPGVKVDITGAAGNSTNLGSITAEAGRVGIVGVIARNSGVVNASSVVSEGGRVFLRASQDAYVDGSGRIVTTGTKGGKVEVLGKRVALADQAAIDASGAAGGGRVMVGGDYQGQNPAVANAAVTYVGAGANIKADATEVGAGGTVIVWADDTTRVHGGISARGGAQGGNGGFVETSGKRNLDVTGARVDTTAGSGTVGQWLLDPTDIGIVAGAGTTTGIDMFGVPTAASATVYAADINTNLLTTDVMFSTASAYGGFGNITVYGGVNISNASGVARTFGLDANGSINVQYGSLISGGAASPLSVVMKANGGSATLAGTIKTFGGDVAIAARDGITLGDGVNTTPGTFGIIARRDGASGGTQTYDTAGYGGRILFDADSDRNGVGTFVMYGGSFVGTTSNAHLIDATGNIGAYGSAMVAVGVIAADVELANSATIKLNYDATASAGAPYGGGDIAFLPTTTGDIRLGNFSTSAPHFTLSNAELTRIFLPASGASNCGTSQEGCRIWIGGVGVPNDPLVGALPTTSRNIKLDQADFTLNNVTTVPKRVHLTTSSTADINDMGDGAGYFGIKAGHLSLNGGGGVGGASGADGVEFIANSVVLGSSISGVRATSIGGGDLAIRKVTANGDVNLKANYGGVTLLPYFAGQNETTPGNFNLTADGDIRFAAAGASYTITGPYSTFTETAPGSAGIRAGGSLSLTSLGGGVQVAGDHAAGAGLFITASNDITVVDGGLASGMGMGLSTTGDLVLTGTNRGTVVKSGGMMSIVVANVRAYGGSAINPGTPGSNTSFAFYGSPAQEDLSGQAAGVAIKSAMAQDIDVSSGDIWLQAGAASNGGGYGGPMYGGTVGIWSAGTQTIKAANIKLFGGAAGHDNNAEIQSFGDQLISLYGGSLQLTGGAGAGGFNNQARIQHGQWTAGVGSGTGNQNIVVYSGGTIDLVGGSGTGTQGYYGSDCYAVLGDACRGGSNDARIENVFAAQTINFSSGGQLNITGGSAGTKNSASIESQTSAATTQQILGNANIVLTGGSAGGSALSYGGESHDLSNDAGIYSNGSGTQTVLAHHLTIHGGTAAVGGAGISNESGMMLMVQTVGNLTMTGGSSSAASPYGGAAYIANRDNGLVSLLVGGNLNATSGSGSSSPVLIGSIDGQGSVQISAANVSLNANASFVAVGSKAAAYGASVTMLSPGNISFNDSTTNPAGKIFIGSDTDGVASPTMVNIEAHGDVNVGSVGGHGVSIGTATSANNMASTVGIVAGPAGYGGNLVINSGGAISGYGGVTLAANNAYGGTGDITVAGGNIASVGATGYVRIYAGRNVDLSGTVNSAATTMAAVDIQAGVTGPMAPTANLYGGNLNLHASTILGYGGVSLFANNATGAQGNLVQTGGSIDAGNLGANVAIRTGGSATLAGPVTAGGSIDIQTGSNVAAVGNGYGGDLSLGGSLTANGGMGVTLLARQGSNASGDLTQSAGTIYGSTVMVNGLRNVVLNGNLTAGTGMLNVTAGDTMMAGYGGNLSIGSGLLQGYGGVTLLAINATGAEGVITQAGGALGSAGPGAVVVHGGGNVDLAGVVSAMSGSVDVQAGVNGLAAMPSAYGGNLTASGAISGYGGVTLAAHNATDTQGDVSVTGSSVTAGGPTSSVKIYAGRNISLSTSLNSISAMPGAIDIQAGVNGAVAPTVNAYGGNIDLAASTVAGYGGINLVANNVVGGRGVVTQTGGSLNAGMAGANINIRSGGNATLAGPIHAGGGIDIQAGMNGVAMPSGYGGDLSIGGNVTADAGMGVNLLAKGGSAAYGDLTQSAGTIYGATVNVNGLRNVVLNGNLTAGTGMLNVAAGDTMMMGYGGNLTVGSGTLQGYGGLMLAAMNATGSQGDITVNGGSLASAGPMGYVKIYAGRNADLSGTVNAAATTMNAVDIQAGVTGTMAPTVNLYGGNIDLNASTVTGYGGINLIANNVTGGQGVVTQTGGSLDALMAGANITIRSGGSATLAAPIHAGGGIDVQAGMNGVAMPSGYGGNLSIGGNLTADAGMGVNLLAKGGSAAYGDLTQSAGTIYGSTVMVNGLRNVVLNGNLTAGTGMLNVTAGDTMMAGYGGDLTVGNGTLQGYGGVTLLANASSASNGVLSKGTGAISNAGSGGITLRGGRNVNLAGSLTTASGPIDIQAGMNGVAPMASGYGGNLVLAAGSAVNSGGVTGLFASGGSSSGGGITQAGNLTSAGNVTIKGDRIVSINGAVESSGGAVLIKSGHNLTAFYGGNLNFGAASSVAAYGGNLEAFAIGASESAGSILQAGGTLYASADLTLAADGNVTTHGSLISPMNLNLFAGVDNFFAPASPAQTSAYGGNVVVGSGSVISGSHVGLFANHGDFPDGTTGHVTQSAAAGTLTASGTSLNVFAAGDVNLLGNVVTGGAAPVMIRAGYDMPGSGPVTAFANLGIAINSLTSNGRDVNLEASGPISANLANASTITAMVSNSSSGGISISHTGATAPTAVALSDGALANRSVGFQHTGSNLVLGGSYSFDTLGTGSLLVAAPSSQLSYNGAFLGGNNIQLSGGTALDIVGSLSKSGATLGLSSGGTINVNNTVQAANALLAAPTINIVGGQVGTIGDTLLFGSQINIGTGAKTNKITAANVLLRGATLGTGNLNLDGEVFAFGQVEFNLASVLGSSGGALIASGSTSSITGIVAGNITLDGSAFEAGDDINLKLTGPSSTLFLLNGGYLLADTASPPGSIFLDFPARSSGGLVVSGPGSGLFIGDTSTPASAANGTLHVTFDPASTTTSTPVINDLISSTAKTSSTETPTDSNSTPTVVTSSSSTQTSLTLGGTAGGTEGTFGADSTSTSTTGTTGGSGGSGSGTSGGESGTGDQSASNEKSSGDGNSKNSKDEKDKDKDKDKKDQAKEEKKDEKPAQKKVAQCSS